MITLNKKNLIKQLKDLADWESNSFIRRAYFKASRIIDEMGEEEFYIRNNFKDIEGIGDAINKKILQFKDSGFIEKWKKLSEDKPAKK